MKIWMPLICVACFCGCSVVRPKESDTIGQMKLLIKLETHASEIRSRLTSPEQRERGDSVRESLMTDAEFEVILFKRMTALQRESIYHLNAELSRQEAIFQSRPEVRERKPNSIQNGVRRGW
jgi:hypothetical protein